MIRRRKARKPLIIIAIIIIVILNIYKTISNQIPSEILAGIDPIISNTTINKQASISPSKINVTYYKLVNDTRYHYEFHFQYTNSARNNNPRLMILLNGHGRTCTDYWEFAVGRRILMILHQYRFFVLAICSTARTFDPDGPVQNNTDVRWIYTSIQKWMNEVFYVQFQRYPRLYIHGVSRGSKLAALLCRILPIREQILTIYPGHPQGLLVHSEYSSDLQKQLQFDPIFTNWFYFDFCYKFPPNNISELCPFQTNHHHYQPVPPTYFIYLQNDQLFPASVYISLIEQIREDSLALGGNLLNNTDGVKFHIVSPANITRSYMQDNFDSWQFKPHASALFYEHYINQSSYNAANYTRQTCSCLSTDFKYYELYPNITQTWSQQKQDEYRDYINAIEQNIPSFCEDICGDLAAYHAMSSRHLDKALQWIDHMDAFRYSLAITHGFARSQ